ncbi:MAG TPA: hypothetical protein VFK22_00170 [Candidatus Dormibacteraeota bacterium]|nr:hypothetical protein [Candidatus Dormibacteraeota bacterium]
MTTQPIISRAILAICVLAAGVALWVFPALFFPAPGANDAPILWNLPLPVVGLTLVGSLVAAARSRQRGDSKTGSIALGVYLIGVAAAFVIGLVVFANLSNDRYWPFLLSPVVFGSAGIAVLAVAVAGQRPSSSELIGGAVIGAMATVALVLWMLARGARDWLLAPYGFDICLLIALEAAVVFFVGGWWRSTPSMAHV